MKPIRFDRLPRSLAGTANRRAALRLLAARLVGGAAIRQAGEVGDAAQVSPQCPEELGYGRCGRWRIGISLMADNDNCGACGVECPLVERCIDGLCVFVSPPR